MYSSEHIIFISLSPQFLQGSFREGRTRTFDVEYVPRRNLNGIATVSGKYIAGFKRYKRAELSFREYCGRPQQRAAKVENKSYLLQRPRLVRHG